MALPTKTITWDNINSSTTSLYEKVLKDNIGKTQPSLAFLMKGNKTYTGGTTITEPLIKAISSTGTSFSGLQRVTVQDQNFFTTADYHIAQYYDYVAISHTDFQKNRGNAAIFNLMEAKFKVLKMSMEQLLTTAIFASGTAAPNLIGLGTHCPSSANTLGGIDGSVETWWDCKRDTTTDLNNLTFGKLQDLYGACSDGNETPTVMITTQAIFDVLWKKAEPRQQHGVDPEFSLGFDNIAFNRKVPIIVDKSCTANYLYMLNTDYIYLRVSDTDNFAFDPWTLAPELVKVKTKVCTFTGQLVNSNRRRHGVFTALS